MNHILYYHYSSNKNYLRTSFIHNMFQQEELSLKSKTFLVIVFIVFSRIITCGSVTLKVTVGEKAILHFKYLCASTKVTLQHSHKLPFYDSTNPRSIPYLPNYLLANQNDTARNECSLHLTINPVMRDETYILIAYKNGVRLPGYPIIKLRVDRPPGKASCEKSNHHLWEWVSLQCTAPVGTLPGQIVCYQSDRRLPPLDELTESGGHLNQIILARLDDVVYCCSSILNERRDKCDCIDWGWDPMNDNVSEIADPCPQAMSTEDPTSTQSTTIKNITSSSSNLVTAPTKYPENHKNIAYWKVICAFMVILILIIIILSLKYHCKARELTHLQSRVTSESQEPCLPANREEVKSYGHK